MLNFPLPFTCKKNKMDAIKDKICDVLALVKAKFGGTTLPTNVLNNSIGETFSFYKYNLSDVNISGNKKVFSLSRVKAKFGGTTLPTNVLDNSTGEMFLFYKYNSSVVNISGNKKVFSLSRVIVTIKSNP